MKQLILIRHAKSSWKHNLRDHERPLKNRGVSDIQLVAYNFSRFNFQPNSIHSSTAVRARETAEIFVKNVYGTQFLIHYSQNLYDFSGYQLEDFIKSLPDDDEKVIIFGHNHALTSISNIFGDRYIDNVPTSGLVHINFDIKHWKDLKKGITLNTIFPRDFK